MECLSEKPSLLVYGVIMRYSSTLQTILIGKYLGHHGLSIVIGWLKPAAALGWINTEYEMGYGNNVNVIVKTYS
jgi:hypothetical protein